MINIARKVKCPICGIMNDKENTIKINNRYYCITCGKKRKQEIAKNTDNWNDLYEYMKQLYGKVNTKMITQIARYRKEPYNYKNKGMELTLFYYHELLEKPHNEESIGLIPYYYDKAKEEYLINREIHKYNSSITFKPITKKIKIKPTKNKITKIKRLIDLNNLEGEKNE